MSWRWVGLAVAALGSAIASMAAAQVWRDDQVCGGALPAPVAARLAGCESAFCVALVDSTRVCSCLPAAGPADAAAPALRFLILDGDHERRRWSIAEFSTLYGARSALP